MFFALTPLTSFANCTSPAAPIGSLDFQTSTFKFCDGTNWQSLGAAVGAASATSDGIVNQIAQSFAGAKTFINNAFFSGNISVTGNVSADLAIVNGIKVGTVSTTCDATTEGTIRYNSTSKKMEYCNGTAWGNISTGTVAAITIGSPSSSLVKSGPVTYLITYGSGTDTATITLAPANISFGGTGAAGCSAAVTGTGATRTVTVNGCTGTGTVTISLAAATANSTTGDPASAAGPSASFNADNTGPNAPTGVTLGSVPANLTSSPTVSYTAPSDVGGSTVASYEAKIIKTSDSSIIADWAAHTSGNAITGLSLSPNTQYSVLVRAIDAFGNIGSSSTAVNWTSTNVLVYDFYIWGAGGGIASYGSGGGGGYAYGQMSLAPGTSVNVIVGCTASGITGGAPGGGNGYASGSGGGGYSAIQVSAVKHLIAGGGGGDGWGPVGGQGGGTIGGTGAAWDAGDDASESGYGGTQAAGGVGHNGTNGSSLQGGSSSSCSFAGGGGGGGYFGGGAGCYGGGGGGGAGGGGSGYASASVSSPDLQGGVQGTSNAANSASAYRPASNGGGNQPGAVVIHKAGSTLTTYSTCGTFSYTLP